MPRFVRVDTDCPDHPKTIRLARLTAKPPSFVFGCLVKLWAWAADKRPDGSLAYMDAAEIEAAAGWAGTPGAFALALQKCRVKEGGHGYIEGVYGESDLKLHDWPEHQGYFIRESIRKTEKSRAARKARTVESGEVQRAPQRAPQRAAGEACSALHSGTAARTEESRRDQEDPRVSEQRSQRSTLIDEERRSDDPEPQQPEAPQSSTPDGLSDGFEEWYKTYPRKVGRGAALRAYRGLMRNTSPKSRPALLAHLKLAVEAWMSTEQWREALREDPHEKRLIPHPATWLNDRRFESDIVDEHAKRLSSRARDPLPTPQIPTELVEICDAMKGIYLEHFQDSDFAFNELQAGVIRIVREKHYRGPPNGIPPLLDLWREWCRDASMPSRLDLFARYVDHKISDLHANVGRDTP